MPTNKSIRINYSNGISVEVEKPIIQTGFATILDNVDLKSGFIKPFKEPRYFSSRNLPISTTGIFSYKGKWIFSKNKRDYVAEDIFGSERIYYTEANEYPRKIINGDIDVRLGTPKPKAAPIVGIKHTIAPDNLQALIFLPQEFDTFETADVTGHFTDSPTSYMLLAESEEFGSSPSLTREINIRKRVGGAISRATRATIKWNGNADIDRYSVLRNDNDGAGYKYVGSTSGNSFVDDFNDSMTKPVNPEDYLDKAPHAYVYTYERDVNGVTDESGVSPLSKSVETKNYRQIARDVFTDGFFEQSNTQTLNYGIEVVPSLNGANGLKKIINILPYENIKEVEFTTETAHGLTTGDEVCLTGNGWTNPYYGNKVYEVVVTSSTKFNIKKLPVPTDVHSGDSDGNANDGLYIAKATTTIKIPDQGSNNPRDKDAIYIYAKDYSVDGALVSESVMRPNTLQEMYIPKLLSGEKYVLTQTGTSSTSVNLGYYTASGAIHKVWYKFVAVDISGNKSQSSEALTITLPNASNNIQKVKLYFPVTPTDSEFDDFSYWEIYRAETTTADAVPSLYRAVITPFYRYATDSVLQTDFGGKFKLYSGQTVWFEDTNNLTHFLEAGSIVQGLYNNLSAGYSTTDQHSFDGSDTTYSDYSFSGKALVDDAGTLVTPASVSSKTYSGFLNPYFPFTSYVVKIKRANYQIVDGDFGKTSVVYEVSTDDGWSWETIAVEDKESCPRQKTVVNASSADYEIDSTPSYLTKTIFSTGKVISPEHIWVRVRVVMANAGKGQGTSDLTYSAQDFVDKFSFKGKAPVMAGEMQFPAIDSNDFYALPELAILGKVEPPSSANSGLLGLALVKIDGVAATVASAPVISESGNGVSAKVSFITKLVNGSYALDGAITINSAGSGYKIGDSVKVLIGSGVTTNPYLDLKSGYGGFERNDGSTSDTTINESFDNNTNNLYAYFTVKDASSGFSVNSREVDTNARVRFRIYDINVTPQYYSEQQKIEGLFKAKSLGGNTFEINKFLPYWSGQTQLDQKAIWTPLNGYYSTWNIYRTGTAGSFQLVKKVPVTQALFLDAKTTAKLGAPTPSYYEEVGVFGRITVSYNKPPLGMTGIISHLGMKFGIDGMLVRWSVSGKPDAWPDDFFAVLPNRPLKLLSYGQYVAIFCQDGIYLLTGNYHSSMIFSKSLISEGCIAPRSVQLTNKGIIYLSKNGLILTNLQSMTNISEPKINKNILISKSSLPVRRAADGSVEESKILSWWIPTTASYFYSNLVYSEGFGKEDYYVAEQNSIFPSQGTIESIGSFVYDNKYFIYWSDSDFFSGHTTLCVEMGRENFPITTLGMKPVDVHVDEFGTPYALFSNQPDSDMSNFFEFKRQQQSRTVTPFLYSKRDGKSLWTLFSGRENIPVAVRSGYQQDSTSNRSSSAYVSNSMGERKKYEKIELNGKGSANVRVFIDGLVIASGNVSLVDSPARCRSVNIPKGSRTGYNLDVEIFGEVDKLLTEVFYNQSKGEAQ